MNRVFRATAAFAVVVTIGACTDDLPTLYGDSSGANVQETEDGRLTITDRTGKAWDVTHAVKAYGFVADGFQFGLGPDAIPPVNDAVLASRGDPSFPAADGQFFVLGTEINVDARAYGIRELSRHEVVNEKFGRTHVAVAY